MRQMQLNEYDVSRELGIDSASVRYLIAKGILQAEPGNNECLISFKELEEFRMRFSQEDIIRLVKGGCTPQETNVADKKREGMRNLLARQSGLILDNLRSPQSKRVLVIVLIVLTAMGHYIHSHRIRVGMTAYQLMEAWGEPDSVIQRSTNIPRIYVPESPSIPKIQYPMGSSRVNELENRLDKTLAELRRTQRQLQNLEDQARTTEYQEIWVYRKRNRQVILGGKSPSLLRVKGWR